MAQALNPSKHITVITPALRVALELCNRPNVDILQIGGLVHQSSASAAGAFGERLLEDISCGLLFMGVDGIEPEFGLSITNLAEASLDKKMISVAQQVVVLADSTKFGRRGIGRICGLDQVDYIITDAGASVESIRQLEEKGVKTIIAE
jgi:DeoR family transcriptional regulator of aga operon